MTRDDLKQLQHMLRPISTRVKNMVARAVVQLVDDGRKLQALQLGVLAGETKADAEHFQQYGFSSVPLEGAEAVVLFPDGDRDHPLVIATGDRSSRPQGGQAGEVCMYTDEGDTIRLGRGHIISLEANDPAGQVRLGSSAASGDVVVQAALDLLVLALTNSVNSTALAAPAAAPGKLALATFLAALTTGIALPAPAIPELASGWKAGTTKTKAE